MKKILNIALIFVLLAGTSAQEKSSKKIFLIGDSTVSDWKPESYYPLTGWGQVLHFFFDSAVQVRNEAISGRSAKSFYNDHWAPVRDSIGEGDYVFIQFGINDAQSEDPARYSEPFGGFQDYLTLFVEESQARGAFPVLVSSVRRNAWNETVPPTLYPAYHDYPVATRELAGELGVSLVDIDQLSIPVLEDMGPDYTGTFLYMNIAAGDYPRWPDGRSDNVHFQEMGAIEMARIVVEDIENSVDDTVLNLLVPHVKPRFPLQVNTNFPDGAMLTRPAFFPEGISLSVMAVLEPGYDLLEWQDESGKVLSTEDRYHFTMADAGLSLFAVLDDDPVPDCEGVLNGGAYVDECGICVAGTTGLLACSSDIESAVYRLSCVRSGLCVEKGEGISQEACMDKGAQEWEFIRDGHAYLIRNIASGLFLGSEVMQAGSYLSVSERETEWRLEKLGLDTFQLAPLEATDLLMEVFGGNREGQSLRLYSRHGGKNQAFVLSKNTSTGLSQKTLKEEFCWLNHDPHSGEFVLSFSPGTLPFDVELFNLLGQPVLKMKSNGEPLQIGRTLPAGIYVLQVTKGQFRQGFKLVMDE